jgi:hypothetical protein
MLLQNAPMMFFTNFHNVVNLCFWPIVFKMRIHQEINTIIEFISSLLAWLTSMVLHTHHIEKTASMISSPSSPFISSLHAKKYIFFHVFQKILKEWRPQSASSSFGCKVWEELSYVSLNFYTFLVPWVATIWPT